MKDMINHLHRVDLVDSFLSFFGVSNLLNNYPFGLTQPEIIPELMLNLKMLVYVCFDEKFWRKTRLFSLRFGSNAFRDKCESESQTVEINSF